MKKFFLLAAVAVLGLSACKKESCAAYTSTKAASRVSSPIMASSAAPATSRQ
jgi:hypothetical protein